MKVHLNQVYKSRHSKIDTLYQDVNIDWANHEAYYASATLDPQLLQTAANGIPTNSCKLLQMMKAFA